MHSFHKATDHNVFRATVFTDTSHLTGLSPAELLNKQLIKLWHLPFKSHTRAQQDINTRLNLQNAFCTCTEDYLFKWKSSFNQHSKSS